jgi:hypothetical protein
MKPRHAAALALVGWYLMVPQLNEKGVNSNAPMSDWDRVESFETAGACAQTLRLTQNAISAMSDQEFTEWSGLRPAVGKKSVSKADALKRWNEGKCVASDDPRLAN